MQISVEVVSGAGPPVVVKRAEGAEVDRLRAEGVRLQQASHPGVVQLLSSQPTATGWEQQTVHAGRPLELVGALSVGQVAALAVGLATTIADLHAAGIIHGRIDASHVLVGTQGRPVLCGFAPNASADPGPAADDVAAIGSIMTSLLGTDTEAEPFPLRRWGRDHRWTGWERRALLTLADQAGTEPATRRPSARRLAAAISEAIPSASLGADRPGSERVGQHRRPPSKGRPATGVVSVVLASMGAVVLAVAISRTGGEADPPPVITATTPLPPSVTAPNPCEAVGGVDLKGDGCQQAAAVNGQIITVGDERFEVGQPGDEIVLRDWDCDGQPTPALLRPRTGEVFVFTKWDRSADVVIGPNATVVGAQRLVADAPAGACSGLSVHTADSVVEIVRAHS